jgi:hypothetical protein
LVRAAVGSRALGTRSGKAPPIHSRKPRGHAQPYIEEEYKRAREHKWYMSARMICVNDLYAFDPNVKVELEEFTDIIGRHFRQPEEGLGFDSSPSAHMWRTLNWPTRFL